jgi:hypothetical protein
MMDTFIKTDWIISQNPCDDYTEAQIREGLGGGMSASEILDLDIPVADRVWVVSQWLPEKQRRQFLADLLQRAFVRERKADREPDPRSVAILTALQEDRWPTEQEFWAASAASSAAAANAEASRAASAAANAAAARAAWAASAAGAAAAIDEAAARERNAQLDCLRRIVAEMDKPAIAAERNK